MADYEQAIALLQDIATEIGRMDAAAASLDAPRILLTGVPTGLGFPQGRPAPQNLLRERRLHRQLHLLQKGPPDDG
jgi:hypothetical protein